MCSCVLTLLSSFAVVCSDFSLCAQAFACVLKLPKRLPMCANVQQPTQRLSPSSGRQTVGKSAALQRVCWHFALGVFWVFCGLHANAVSAVSRVTELLAGAPAGTHGGPSCCPVQGFSHQRRQCHPCAIPQSTPHRDLHHESMSLKIRSQFQQIRSTIGLKSSLEDVI